MNKTKIIFLLLVLGGLSVVVFFGLESLKFDTAETRYYTEDDIIPEGSKVGDPIPLSTYDSEYPPFLKNKYINDVLFQTLVVVLLVMIFIVFTQHKTTSTIDRQLYLELIQTSGSTP